MAYNEITTELNREKLEAYTFVLYTEDYYEVFKKANLALKAKMEFRFDDCGYFYIRCLLDETKKIVYMPESLYKKYYKKLKVKNVNLDNLHTITKKAMLNEDGALFYKKKEIDIETQRKLSKKAELIYRNKYIFSKKDNYIHDKSCPFVELISLDDLGGANNLIAERQMCMECFRKLVVRTVYLHNYEDTSRYYNFFLFGRIKKEDLWGFLTDNTMKLRMENTRTLVVRCNEDLWKIVLDENTGTFKLLHNNYKMTENLQREFFDTFHEQEIENTFLTNLLHYIKNYKWDVSHMEGIPLPQTAEIIEEDVDEDKIISLKHSAKDATITGYKKEGMKSLQNLSHKDLAMKIFNIKK